MCDYKESWLYFILYKWIIYSNKPSCDLKLYFIFVNHMFLLLTLIIAPSIVEIFFFTSTTSMCLSPLSALNYTPNMRIKSGPLLANTLSLFFPISRNFSFSLLSSRFTTIISDLSPFIFISLMSKNLSAINSIFFASFLLLAIHCVSSAYAKVAVHIFMLSFSLHII
jgi:hypothetical protein